MSPLCSVERLPAAHLGKSKMRNEAHQQEPKDIGPLPRQNPTILSIEESQTLLGDFMSSLTSKPEHLILNFNLQD